MHLSRVTSQPAASFGAGAGLGLVRPLASPQPNAPALVTSTQQAAFARLFGQVSPSVALEALPPPRREEKSVGFYTGTFDPPTRAHLGIIRALVDERGLDRLVVVVNQKSHKTFKASAAERKAMLEAALGEHYLDHIDVVVEPPRGKSALLQELRSSDARVFHVMGQDSFERLPEDERRRDDVTRLVIARPEQSDASVDGDESASLIELHGLVRGVSSTKVRGSLRDGGDADGMLDPAVLGYIRAHDLYRAHVGQEGEALRRAFERSWQRYATSHRLGDRPAPEFVDTQSPHEWLHYFAKVANEPPIAAAS